MLCVYVTGYLKPKTLFLTFTKRSMCSMHHHHSDITYFVSCDAFQASVLLVAMLFLCQES